MKLYRITQNVNNGYDTYDSAIVCAEDPQEAQKIHPDGHYDYKEDGTNEEYKKADSNYGSWAKKTYVKVKEIGKANSDIKKGVIVSSFNAG